MARLGADPAVEATMHGTPKVIGPWTPWKASYLAMRDQRDDALAEARRFRRILDPGYVTGDLVEDGSW